MSETNTPQDAAVAEDDKAVRSLPLDTEDGGTVVIAQQNVGPGNQVGGGEFKNAVGRTTAEAAAEQAALEHDAPIGATTGQTASEGRPGDGTGDGTDDGTADGTDDGTDDGTAEHDDPHAPGLSLLTGSMADPQHVAEPNEPA